MEYSVRDMDVNTSPEAFVIDGGSLFERLTQFTDCRHARGNSARQTGRKAVS